MGVLIVNWVSLSEIHEANWRGYPVEWLHLHVLNVLGMQMRSHLHMQMSHVPDTTWLRERPLFCALFTIRTTFKFRWVAGLRTEGCSNWRNGKKPTPWKFTLCCLNASNESCTSILKMKVSFKVCAFICPPCSNWAEHLVHAGVASGMTQV